MRIYEPHQDQITINEDQKSLTLKCTSNWTSIDWYKGNMELMTSDRISVSKFVGGNVAYISLLIPYITVKDSGTYTCKTNIDGMEEDSISVTVTPSVVKRKFFRKKYKEIIARGLVWFQVRFNSTWYILIICLTVLH